MNCSHFVSDFDHENPAPVQFCDEPPKEEPEVAVEAPEGDPELTNGTENGPPMSIKEALKKQADTPSRKRLREAVKRTVGES